MGGVGDPRGPTLPPFPTSGTTEGVWAWWTPIPPPPRTAPANGLPLFPAGPPNRPPEARRCRARTRRPSESRSATFGSALPPCSPSRASRSARFTGRAHIVAFSSWAWTSAPPFRGAGGMGRPPFPWASRPPASCISEIAKDVRGARPIPEDTPPLTACDPGARDTAGGGVHYPRARSRPHLPRSPTGGWRAPRFPPRWGGALPSWRHHKHAPPWPPCPSMGGARVAPPPLFIVSRTLGSAVCEWGLSAPPKVK